MKTKYEQLIILLTLLTFALTGILFVICIRLSDMRQDQKTIINKFNETKNHTIYI